MITFDGFVDTYYAYDFQAPHNNERAYTTQPQRSGEPSLNLAYAGATFKNNKVRARLALQAGNSVKANYAPEANEDLGIFQEAYVGYQINDRTWLDGGIYLAHIGMESWISKDNFTYSRSLMLDNVPYYATGLRLQHTIDSKNFFDVHLMNGWQNISETNSSKAFGVQYKHKMNPEATFTYNNYFGDENVVPGQKARFRTYHDFIVEKTLSPVWQMQASVDIGTQTQQRNDGVDAWGAAAATFRQKIAEKQFFAYRAEYYCDPHEANVGTGTRNGYRVISASVNYDYHLPYSMLWRTELRGFQSKDKIYPVGQNNISRNDGFIATSWSASF